MILRNNLKLPLALILSLSMFSCNTLTNTINDNININQSNNLNTIKGKVEFPRLNPKQVDKNSLSIKATLSEVGTNATVSLVYPPDDISNPNLTIATGLTDNSGNFTINTGFSPELNKIYLLEATKRIGASGNDLISVNTYIRHNGSVWESITSPSININKETTAIVVIDKNDNSISSSDTIGKIVSGVINPIGSVTVQTINNVSAMVNSLLIDNSDPLRFISYINNEYFVIKETKHHKNNLLDNKYCPNCDLKNEDLSNKDLSNGDLSNSNLSNSNLTNSNLSNSNLTNINISGANLIGATWTDGRICQNNSIGLCIFPDIQVNTYITNNQRNPSIAIDSTGNFVVTWESYNQNGNGFEIYAQRYNSSGIAQGSEFQVNTYTTDFQQNPSIAMNSTGNFVVTWESYNQDSNGFEIYAQRYNSLGQAQGSEFKVNSYTTNAQSNPSLAMDSTGNFVIAWESNGQDGSVYGVYAQRYNSSGIAQGSEFQVNTYITNNQQKPSITMDSTGNFVIAWHSYSQDHVFDSGIYAQRYNSSGIAQGSEFQVNTYTTDYQLKPKISMDSTGNFVITWQSFAQDGSGFGIYAQRYNSLGQAQGSEFQVNSYVAYHQQNPSIAMDSTGNFVIAWESNTQDGSNYGIYVKRYNSNGITQGSEFQVNTYTTDSQQIPSIAMNSTGNFVVTWESYNQDGNGFGIYAQRHNSSGNQL
ncbi:MAG: pentapeptide repeat-containing protein [Candidatus Sericytochromatia bacterium]